MATQDRGSHEKYLKEIVCVSFWDIRNWIAKLDVYWRAMNHLSTLHFYPEYIDLPGVCIQKYVMINWILQ